MILPLCVRMVRNAWDLVFVKESSEDECISIHVILAYIVFSIINNPNYLFYTSTAQLNTTQAYLTTTYTQTSITSICQHAYDAPHSPHYCCSPHHHEDDPCPS